MVIKPGVNSPSTMDTVKLMRTNSKHNIAVTFQDDSGTPVDVDETTLPSGEPDGELSLEVTTVGGRVVFEESYWPNPVPSTRRITHPATGEYRLKYGSETTDQTDRVEGLLFNWAIRKNSTGDDFYRTQLVEVISPKVLSLLPQFRLLLDKSIKVISPIDWCTLGYSDAQLILYLKMGLSKINSLASYPAWPTLDTFPIELHAKILMDSGLIAALESQYLFAVDTDVPQFSDQGHAFNITHSVQLKSLLDSLTSRFEPEVRVFKFRYCNVGSLSIELRMGLRFYAQLLSSPYGAMFTGGIPNTNTLSG